MNKQNNKTTRNRLEEYFIYITKYFKSWDYTNLLEINLRTINNKRIIRDLNNIDLSLILKVFEFMFDRLWNNDKYKYITIKQTSIRNQFKLQNSTISFILNFLKEISILDIEILVSDRSKYNPNKYKLRTINEQDKIEHITWNPEVFKILDRNKKNVIKNKSTCKSRLKKNRDRETNKIIQNKIDKIKGPERTKLQRRLSSGQEKVQPIINKYLKSFDTKVNKIKALEDVILIANNTGGITMNKLKETKYGANNRIGSFITQMYNYTRDFMLFEDVQTESLDIVASFPVMLSYMIQESKYSDKPDAKLFHKLCTTDDIYGYIKVELKLNNREEAKNLWNKIYGERYKHYEDGKFIKIFNTKLEPFYKLFPSIINFTDDIKNEYQLIYDYQERKKNRTSGILHNQVAKYEAEYVNQLRDQINKQIGMCKTIFDEFIFKSTDTEEIINFIIKYNKSINKIFQLRLRSSREIINFNSKINKQKTNKQINNMKEKQTKITQKAIITEPELISNANVSEIKEDVHIKPEMDYKLKKQIKETVIIKLTEMYSYSLVVNLNFRPILNNIINDSYDLIKDGQKLNKTILTEMINK